MDIEELMIETLTNVELRVQSSLDDPDFKIRYKLWQFGEKWSCVVEMGHGGPHSVILKDLANTKEEVLKSMLSYLVSTFFYHWAKACPELIVNEQYNNPNE